MPSIHRRPGSPYWHGAFTLPDGRRALRSTRCTQRKDALKICLEWQAAADNRATESQIRRVFSDIHKVIHGRSLEAATVKDYSERWLARKAGETAVATIHAYRRAVADFLASLGDRAASDLSGITPADVARVRDQWAGAGAPKTTNNKLKALRVMFQCAWRDGLTQENPAAKVPALKNEAGVREAFTLDQVKRLLAASRDEWRGMILAGLYTGQRLGDLARLRWSQVDLSRREISLQTAKTRRHMILPIAPSLLDWLLEQSTPEDNAAPVFTRLASKAERGGSSPLSQEFHEIMVAAGLATARASKNKPSGKGRRAPRVRSALTFHSLRHTATSFLKAAGVPESVVRDIIGHDSADVSRHYTHIDEPTKRDALAKLPVL